MRYQLFILPKKYRCVAFHSSLYDKEIDAKCKALPFNFETLIPCYMLAEEYNLKEINLKPTYKYLPLPKSIEVEFTKSKGYNIRVAKGI